ncbi:MAG: hypothetical protein KDN22_34145 [Verrucomicrobiae bacterium]|nr:hypothetical protein [Verrucomicrobiae bacterium]
MASHFTNYLKSTPGCPHKGWEWLGATDLHDDEGLEFGEYETCEFCGHEQIRYVHALRHCDWKEEIAVGRICANNLSGDPDIDITETRLRNRAQRRNNFPRLKSWKMSTRGNEWINYLGHHVVVICWSDGSFRLRIDGELGKLTFADVVAAKRRAFDVVIRRVEQTPRH